MNEIICNDFIKVNEKEFVKLSSIPHLYLINIDYARWLNIKYSITIYWCCFKQSSEEFNSYLADLGYGENEQLIGNKMFKAIQYVFDEL